MSTPAALPSIGVASAPAPAPVSTDVCFFLFKGIASAECASWVQAWGSILAIAATAILFLIQIRREHRIRKELHAHELIAQAKFALEALHSAQREVHSYQARFKSGLSTGKFVYDTADLEEVVALLREAYLGQMFPEARVSLIRVRQSLVKLQQIAEGVPGHTILAYAHSGNIALRVAHSRIGDAREAVRRVSPSADVGGQELQEMQDRLADGKSNFVD